MVMTRPTCGRSTSVRADRQSDLGRDSAALRREPGPLWRRLSDFRWRGEMEAIGPIGNPHILKVGFRSLHTCARPSFVSVEPVGGTPDSVASYRVFGA